MEEKPLEAARNCRQKLRNVAAGDGAGGPDQVISALRRSRVVV